MSDSGNSILHYLDNRDSSVAALAGQEFAHHPQYAAGGSHPPGYNDFPGVHDDPFLSEQERMNRIVLTREERQEGYDSNLAYSEPRGMAIGDIPRSAPRGFQLHDGPVSPSLSPGYTEDYSNRPQRFPSTSSHAPSHYTVHPPPSFVNPDLHHESEFRYPAALPATHDFGYAASPRHSTVSRSATLTSEHASLGEWNENEKAATVVPQGFYDNIEADFERAERKERRKKIAIWVGGIALLAIVLGVGIGVGVKNHHSTSSLADSAADGNSTSSGKSSASASFAFLSGTSTTSQGTTSSSPTSDITSSTEAEEVAATTTSSSDPAPQAPTTSSTTPQTVEITSTAPEVITTTSKVSVATSSTAPAVATTQSSASTAPALTQTSASASPSAEATLESTTTQPAAATTASDSATSEASAVTCTPGSVGCSTTTDTANDSVPNSVTTPSRHKRMLKQSH